MRIALCQVNPIIGDFAYNKNKILEGYRRAVDDNADIAIFPELSLLGYPPLDLVEKKEFRQAVHKVIDELASITGETALLFGSITEDDDLIGTNIHNSAILCYNNKVQFIQHKSLIPNYDVFDEARYFEPAKEVYVHKFKDEILGISICEDIWNDQDYWHQRRYILDPVDDMIKKGATLLLNISASPYSYGKRENRKDMLSTLVKIDNVPLAYVCCVGAQTELIFDGASMCFNPDGELVKLGKTYEEDYLIFDTKAEYQSITKVEKSFEEEVLRSLIYGLKEYCSKLKFKKVLLGLSGGMDSALVAFIAVKALGKENVHVLLMPSEFSSEGSISDSLKLVENLGIEHNIVSIQPVFEEINNILQPLFSDNSWDITEENLQARIRGMYLMAFSNKFNYLVLATGNKSEAAVGYSTLYGDMCGGLAVIGDVYKTDIYRIANFINKDEEIIPGEIINKAPSAELRHNQTDQDSLPPYELLDDILRMYLEENKEAEEVTNIIGDKEIVKKVLRLVDINEFKRKQSAPVLRVSSKAFGYGRRYPIVQGWRK